MSHDHLYRQFLSAAAALVAIVLLCLWTASPALGETSAWAALQEEINRAENGGVITLSQDITALPDDSRLTVPSGKRLTLDLNGHTLDRNQREYSASNGSVLYISRDAILTIRSSGETEGRITGGYHDYGGGIVNDGTLILESGSVTGNAALDSGGGIANNGMMTLLGGSVTGNTSLSVGGGIYNGATAYLAIDGDAVTGNQAPTHPDIANEGKLSILGEQPNDVDYKDMPVLKRYMAQLSILPTVATVLALLLAVLPDSYMSRSRKRSMIVIIVLVSFVILQNCLEYRLSLLSGTHPLRLPVSVLGYTLRPIILAMFLTIVRPSGRYRIAWVLVGVNAAIYLTAFFSRLPFWYTANGNFKAGPLRHTCTVVSVILFAWLFILTMQQFHPRGKKESWLPIMVTVLIAGAAVMDFTVIFDRQPISFLTMAIVISCLFYYNWLHLQFVREHEAGLRAEQRIQIMMSQIKPHFLYNALGTIEDLCGMDPQKAQETTVKFSQYLRGNMDSISKTEPIPFEEELAHTKLYLDMEQVRFGRDLHIRYEIHCSAFSLPALTLEPLAENAVQHGIREKPDGRGTVTILSRDAGDHYEVSVTDDGLGFDPAALSDDGTHIGISNVRDRVEKMCSGALQIQSGTGKGTTATILIPKGSAPR